MNSAHDLGPYCLVLVSFIYGQKTAQITARLHDGHNGLLVPPWYSSREFLSTWQMGYKRNPWASHASRHIWYRVVVSFCPRHERLSTMLLEWILGCTCAVLCVLLYHSSSGNQLLVSAHVRYTTHQPPSLNFGCRSTYLHRLRRRTSLYFIFIVLIVDHTAYVMS